MPLQQKIYFKSSHREVKGSQLFTVNINTEISNTDEGLPIEQNDMIKLKVEVGDPLIDDNSGVGTDYEDEGGWFGEHQSFQFGFKVKDGTQPGDYPFRFQIYVNDVYKGIGNSVFTISDGETSNTQLAGVRKKKKIKRRKTKKKSKKRKTRMRKYRKNNN